MPEAHSYWSASGFESVMLCPGKKVMEVGRPDNTSEHAAEGTVAHQILTWALENRVPAATYLNRVIHTNAEGRVVDAKDAKGWSFTVDQDMADHVQVCIDWVWETAGDDGVVLVDRKVNYASYLGVDEDSAWGTLDVAILLPGELVICDFKYGRGVEVSAGELERQEFEDIDGNGERCLNEAFVPRPNPQMALYALGAYGEFGDLGDFEQVRLVISQPRISRKPAVFELSVSQLAQWAVASAQSVVTRALDAGRTGTAAPGFAETFLRPGDKQCKFCKAKATCPARRDAVSTAVTGVPAASPDEFVAADPVVAAEITDADWLAACLSKVDLIEDWCKAIRAEADRRLLAGEKVPGFKVVAGKRGARKWADEAAAEAMLKTFRLKQEEMYDFKLISPTAAEKLHKAEAIGKRQWPKLQELITQVEGKPHVAPETDPRPALDIRPVVEDFQDVQHPADDLA